MSKPDKVAFLNELADLMERHGVLGIEGTRDRDGHWTLDFGFGRHGYVEIEGTDIGPSGIRRRAKELEGSQDVR